MLNVTGQVQRSEVLPHYVRESSTRFKHALLSRDQDGIWRCYVACALTGSSEHYASGFYEKNS